MSAFHIHRWLKTAPSLASVRNWLSRHRLCKSRETARGQWRCGETRARDALLTGNEELQSPKHFPSFFPEFPWGHAAAYSWAGSRLAHYKVFILPSNIFKPSVITVDSIIPQMRAHVCLSLLILTSWKTVRWKNVRNFVCHQFSFVLSRQFFF